MTIAFVQGKAAFSGTSSNTTVTATFDTGATAGNFLLCLLGGDKNGGAGTLSGWNLITSSPATDVSLYGWWKIAAGGETSVSPSWATGTFGTNIYIAEYSDTAVTGSTSWEILGSATNINSGSATSLGCASGTTGSLANDGRAVAWAALDSSQNVTAVTSWSNSFTARHSGTGLAGRAGLFTAENAVTAGSGVSSTITVTGTADQWSGAIVVFRKYVVTVTPTLAHRIVGTMGIIKTRTADADSVRLKIGTNTGVTTGVVYSSAETPDGLEDTFHDTAGLGLTAGSVYYYRVAMTDTAATEHLDVASTVGRLVVPRTGASNFNFCFASCGDNESPGLSVAAIDAREDDFFLHLGDLYYADGSGQTVSNYREKMITNRVEATNHGTLFATTPTAYIPSDHDWGMAADAGATNQSGAISPFNQVYRETWPNTLVQSTTGVYQTFVWGRIRFVMLDCRSFRSANNATDNSSKTMLGSTQKTWLFDLLDDEDEPVWVICSDTPFTGPTTANEDHWAGFNTERQEIVTELATHEPAKQFLFLSGDMHAVAYSAGTAYSGGIPNWSAAPLYGAASIKGDPWDAVYPTSGSSIVTQYGRVQVTDDGTTITMAFNGYSSDNTSRVSTSLDFIAPRTGTIAQTLPKLTQAASGTHVPPAFTGTAAQTLPRVAQSAAGTVPPVFTGTAAQTLPKVTQAAAGDSEVPVFAGTAAQTLPIVTQAASGAVDSPGTAGTIGQTLPRVAQEFVGDYHPGPITGTAAQTLPRLEQAAAGEVDNPPAFTGTTAQSLPAITQAVSGDYTPPPITGTIIQTLPMITQSGSGAITMPPVTGTIAATLPAVTQAAAGDFQITYTATVAQTLPRVGQLLSTPIRDITATIGASQGSGIRIELGRA